MKLATYLQSHSISRREFALKIGISEASLSRYITGDRMPRPKIARAIMTVSGGKVTPNDFITTDQSITTAAE